MSSNPVAYPQSDLFPPAYSFLSHPPQKPRPSQPLPPPPDYENLPPSPHATTHISGRRRSSVMYSITAWAENVQPGSPGSTPRKSSFVESSDSESRAVLKAAGYTSSIVNVQNVILPPAVPTGGKKSRYSLMPAPRPSSSHKEIRRTNSQTSLKGSHSKSTSTPRRPGTSIASSAVPLISKDHRVHRRDRSDATIMKDKKAKYGKLPPPLVHDLALAQFIDGGNTEDQVRKYVEAKAKAAGAPKVNGQYVGAGDVYRDAQGGIWRDPEEELEYAHLLDRETGEKSWVGFNNKSAAALEDEIRRGSVSTMETQDSDLDPRYAVQPNDDEIARYGGVVPPHAPSRSARHLHKSEALLNPFPVPASSSSPANSKPRVRPPPLSFDPCSSGPGFMYHAIDSANQEAGRRDFMESSFSPTPVTAKQVSSKTGSTSASDSKSKLGMKGLLKAVGMKK